MLVQNLTVGNPISAFCFQLLPFPEVFADKLAHRAESGRGLRTAPQSARSESKRNLLGTMRSPPQTGTPLHNSALPSEAPLV
jgi:hypothetical protein